MQTIFVALIAYLSCLQTRLCQLVSKLKAWNSEQGDNFFKNHGSFVHLSKINNIVLTWPYYFQASTSMLRLIGKNISVVSEESNKLPAVFVAKLSKKSTLKFLLKCQTYCIFHILLCICVHSCYVLIMLVFCKLQN